MRFKNKRAIVTGGAGGIGAAIALALAREGAIVAATSVAQAELDDRAADPAFASIVFALLDVRDEQAVAAYAASFDTLDILVNCAGTSLRGAPAFEEDGFQRVVDVNLSGTMRMSRACHPQLAASQGAIVNIASMMSFFGSGTAPGYAASKGGVAMLTKSLAIAWAPDGIRVNAVAPGWIETPLSKAIIKNTDPELYARVEQRTPMKRWGQPEHIGKAVAFLCSDDADFITGTILPVDGGYSAA